MGNDIWDGYDPQLYGICLKIAELTIVFETLLCLEKFKFMLMDYIKTNILTSLAKDLLHTYKK